MIPEYVPRLSADSLSGLATWRNAVTSSASAAARACDGDWRRVRRVFRLPLKRLRIALVRR
jgi:hypothetical protein